MAGVAAPDPGLCAKGEALVGQLEALERAGRASPKARAAQWIQDCRLDLAFGQWAASIDDSELEAYGAAVGMAPAKLRQFRKVYLFHEQEAEAIVAGTQEPRASWTVYRDAQHLGLEAFNKTVEWVTAQNAAHPDARPMTVTTRLVREVAGKEAYDRPSYGKRARRDRKTAAERRADDIETNLGTKEARQELHRRKERAQVERANEKRARQMAAEIEANVARKIRAGDTATKKGPIRSVGDLLPRLQSAAVMLSALALKPEFVPGWSRDTVVHELRQVKKYAGLSLQVLTGEIPEIDAEAVHEAIVLMLGPSDEVPQEPAYQPAVKVEDGDDVADAEIV